MKLKLSIIAALLLCLSSIFMVSCKDKADSKCASVPCAAGYCEKGNCVCPAGYSGQHCTDLWMVKFSGGWNLTEYEMNGSRLDGPYFTTLGPVQGSFTDLELTNFWNEGSQVILVMNSATQFSLKEQQVVGSGFMLLSMEGTLNGNQIMGTYKIEYQGEQHNLKFIMVKM